MSALSSRAWETAAVWLPRYPDKPLANEAYQEQARTPQGRTSFYGAGRGQFMFKNCHSRPADPRDGPQDNRLDLSQPWNQPAGPPSEAQSA